MRVLTIIALCITFCSCQQTKPLTPQEAFQRLKDAYINNDMEKVSQMLSTNSKKRILSIIQNLQSIHGTQIQGFASYYNIPVESIQQLDMPRYLELQKKIANVYGDDVLLTALNQPVSQVTISNSKATVALYNGMSLLFVKEGPYWYFEYE